MLKERLEFLRGPRGLRAARYFGLKLIARIEAFRVVAISDRPNVFLALPAGWHYVGIYSDDALSRLPRGILELVTAQCGSNPCQLLSRGGSVHLLLSGTSLIAQLSIDRESTCKIDSPPLYMSMAETDAFLSYLYTWPAFRRQGAAKYLIAVTVNDLLSRDVRRVIAHVLATNVPSLAAFERAGWKTCATILCTLQGRLLIALGAERAGLCFRSPT